MDSGAFQTVEVSGGLIREPMPWLRVIVQMSTTMLGVRINAQAHYFAEDKTLIESVQPFPCIHDTRTPSALPTYFRAGKPVSLCFPVPKRVDTYAVWNAIVVVGDTNDVSLVTFPNGAIVFNAVIYKVDDMVKLMEFREAI